MSHGSKATISLNPDGVISLEIKIDSKTKNYSPNDKSKSFTTFTLFERKRSIYLNDCFRILPSKHDG